jgi:hypothetical protein
VFLDFPALLSPFRIQGSFTDQAAIVSQIGSPNSNLEMLSPGISPP